MYVIHSIAVQCFTTNMYVHVDMEVALTVKNNWSELIRWSAILRYRYPVIIKLISKLNVDLTKP